MSTQLAFIIEYVGTNFHGWQVQPGMRTIQQELERILAMILHIDRVTVNSSGRTDSGVHARAQVCTVLLEELTEDLPTIARAVSHMLNGELCVRAIAVVPESFHPRRSAKRKQYEYSIINSPVPPAFSTNFINWIPRPLDTDAMNRAASLLVGEHDFKSFQGATEEDIPTIKQIFRSEVIRKGQSISYVVEGNGFLKQMVRNIVGTLVLIGQGKKTPEWIHDILSARNRRIAGPTALAQGLCLNWVLYEEFRSDEPWGTINTGLVFRY
jgi:tRNA pseudouridine38-40 synthase